MTKRRAPGTVEDALDQAAGYVTRETIAAWLGKSAALVRKFGDPDNDNHLQVRQALEIDRQLALQDYPQPFAELFEERALGHARSAAQLARALASGERPLQMAAGAVRDAAKIISDLERAEADGVYSAAEVDTLCRQLEALRKQVTLLKRGVAARGRK